MSLITIPRTRALLGITDTTRDEAIGALIPVVRDDVVAICNNSFTDVPVPAFMARRAGDDPLTWVPDPDSIKSNSIFRLSSSLSFAAGPPPVINDSENGWLTSDFARGLDILVWGSLYNDGYYTVSTEVAPTASALTLVGPDEADESGPFDQLITEAKNAFVRVFRVQWGGRQRGLELVVAEMIGYHLQRQKQFAAETGDAAGVESERLGDYSVSYAQPPASGASVAYPRSILSRLDSYRRPVFL